MTIDKIDIQNIELEDLKGLVEACVPENIHLEFKRESYSNSDSGKKEFLKDISALANTNGGHLILGIEEEAGVASSVPGLIGISNDQEILRLEQIARVGLEPPIARLQFQPVRVSDDTHAIVIRVPKTWNGPHRVIAGNSYRFWARNSAGNFQPTVGELRNMFSERETILESARNFRNRRVEEINDYGGTRPLVRNGRLIFHIIPFGSISGEINLHVEDLYQKRHSFVPIGADGMSSRINFEGMINERPGEQNLGYTQLFRSGIVEATIGGKIRNHPSPERRSISPILFEREITSVFNPYIDGLKLLDVPTPFLILMTLLDMHAVTYWWKLNNFDDDPHPPFFKNELHLPEGIIQDYGTESQNLASLRPAFDSLWNSIGYPCDPFFDEEGLWVGEQQVRMLSPN